MVDDIDIFRAAKVLMDHHGDAARTRADTRADELLQAGDQAGHAVWKRIGAAVDELANVTADGPTS